MTGEFPLGVEVGTNDKIAAGPDGNLWFAPTNQAGKEVVRITPSGETKVFDVGAVTGSGIAAGPEGKMWLVRNGGAVIFDPAKPETSANAVPITGVENESSIVLGPDGNMWIATKEKLVRVDPANPVLGNKAFPIPGMAPKDIDVYGSGLVIADQLGARLLTVVIGEPPVITEYKLGGASQGVAGGLNGQIAFTEAGGNPEKYGLLTPPGPALTTVSVTDPFGVVLGQDGAYWIAHFTTDSLTRLSTDNVSTPLTGFAKGSGPRQITTGPGGTLWVTLDGNDKVARVSGVEPPPPPPVVLPKTPPTSAPDTTIDKGPKGVVKTKRKRARVRFKFSSTTAGAEFECRIMRRLTKDGKAKAAKAAKVPPFTVCASPKKYRLRPGHYRFEVRAKLAGAQGLADPTPATRNFRVVRLPHRR